MDSPSSSSAKRKHYRCSICQEDFYKYKTLLVHKSACNIESLRLQHLEVELTPSGLAQVSTESPEKQPRLPEDAADSGSLVEEFESAMLRKKKAIELSYDAAREAKELADVTRVIKSQKATAIKRLHEALLDLQVVKYSDASKREKFSARKRLTHATKTVEELSVKENYAIAALENSASYQRIAMEKALEASVREQSLFRAAVASLLTPHSS